MSTASCSTGPGRRGAPRCWPARRSSPGWASCSARSGGVLGLLLIVVLEEAGAAELGLEEVVVAVRQFGDGPARLGQLLRVHAQGDELRGCQHGLALVEHAPKGDVAVDGIEGLVQLGAGR